MQRILDIIDSLGKIASRRELIARGITGPQLTAAVRCGLITRIRHGHYALPDAPFEARVAVRLGGRLGCLSALDSYGYWGGYRREGVHITLPRNAARLRWFRDDDGLHADTAPTTSCIVHWRDAPSSGRGVRESSWRVPLHTALSDVVACAPRADVRAAFESVVAGGAYRLETAQSMLDALISQEIPAMRLYGGSGSGAESHLVEVLVGLGLRFAQQVVFVGIGRVDFLVEGRLVVEVDGYTFHSGEPQFELDRQRDAALLARGYPVLRLPARLVVEAPTDAASRVSTALESVKRGRMPRVPRVA